MRTPIRWSGAIALTWVGMVLATGGAPQGATPETPPQAQPADTKAKPAVTPEPAVAPGSNPQEAAIREQVQAFTKAYNVPDVDALAASFTDDAVIVDSSGTETRGKTAIGEMYAGEFENVPGIKLESQIEEIRFLTPDVARVEGRSRLSSGTGDTNEFNRFSALMLRRDGKWLVAEIRESATPAQEITPYERLQELEWMVGDWVDEGDDNKISSNVRWADNKSFLIRTYNVEIRGEKASSGTMVIGWDPQTSQIKSWVFSSEGGHGEGLWTRTGEKQWIVKAHGMRHDGQPNSATQIHTILNKDVVKTSSIDRIIGGQIAPDIVDVVMVRQPPRPRASPAEAAKSDQ